MQPIPSGMRFHYPIGMKSDGSQRRVDVLLDTPFWSLGGIDPVDVLALWYRALPGQRLALACFLKYWGRNTRAWIALAPYVQRDPVLNAALDLPEMLPAHTYPRCARELLTDKHLMGALLKRCRAERENPRKLSKSESLLFTDLSKRNRALLGNAGFPDTWQRQAVKTMLQEDELELANLSHLDGIEHPNSNLESLEVEIGPGPHEPFDGQSHQRYVEQKLVHNIAQQSSTGQSRVPLPNTTRIIQGRKESVEVPSDTSSHIVPTVPSADDSLISNEYPIDSPPTKHDGNTTTIVQGRKEYVALPSDTSSHIVQTVRLADDSLISNEHPIDSPPTKHDGNTTTIVQRRKESVALQSGTSSHIVQTVRSADDSLISNEYPIDSPPTKHNRNTTTIVQGQMESVAFQSGTSLHTVQTVPSDISNFYPVSSSVSPQSVSSHTNEVRAPFVIMLQRPQDRSSAPNAQQDDQRGSPDR